VFFVVAIFAPFIAPHSPTKVDLAHSLQPPVWQSGGGWNFPLGTDLWGRDVLSRIIYGARLAFEVAIIGVGISGAVGSMLGVLAGFKGGWIDYVISRTMDIFMGIPMILLALVLAVVLGPSMFNVILVICLLFWVGYARLSRAETFKVRELGFVTLARTAGASEWTIMLRHVMPNIINTLVVLATLNLGGTIMLEAGLSFLGAGIPPPNPSWGSMVSDGRDTLTTAWWVSVMPGVAIMLIVLSANLLGDWLRDKLDPRLRAL